MGNSNTLEIGMKTAQRAVCILELALLDCESFRKQRKQNYLPIVRCRINLRVRLLYHVGHLWVLQLISRGIFK